MRRTILKECLRIARRRNTPKLHSEFGRFHHFSFIVQNNTIIEYGTNRVGSIPALEHFYLERSKIHSEACAYSRAKGLLSNTAFEVVNIRLNKKGVLRGSKPCKCCSAFLEAVGATHIYYSTNDGFEKEVL